MRSFREGLEEDSPWRRGLKKIPRNIILENVIKTCGPAHGRVKRHGRGDVHHSFAGRLIGTRSPAKSQGMTEPGKRASHLAFRE